ncbi:MAG: Hsp20/alpha crystallin family protein [Bacillota bacterium]
MFRRDDPADWMWARACEMLDQAERMHRRFFRLATTPEAETAWEPPVDVFEGRDDLVIVLALPGVVAENVEVVAAPDLLVVRATRALPLAGKPHVVRHLEIPYGEFERRIALPAARFELASRELSHGCLVLRLRRIDTEGI